MSKYGNLKLILSPLDFLSRTHTCQAQKLENARPEHILDLPLPEVTVHTYTMVLAPLTPHRGECPTSATQTFEAVGLLYVYKEKRKEGGAIVATQSDQIFSLGNVLKIAILRVQKISRKASPLMSEFSASWQFFKTNVI